jgi:hypothetical protein
MWYEPFAVVVFDRHTTARVIDLVMKQLFLALHG